MAIIRISPEVLDQQLFGGTQNPICILDASFDHQRGTVILKIEGDDVPDVTEVRGICTVTKNRRGEQHHSMKFEVVE